MEYQNINQEQNMSKKEHDFRKIMLTIVGVFVVLAAVSGGTYAYYAFSASNNTTITGTAATADLELIVTDPATSSTLGTGPLVPQPAQTITQALVGTNGVNCVDGNGNTVCRVYQIAIKNTSTAAAYVRGYLKFANGNNSLFQNVKWLLLGQTGSSYTKYTSTSGVTYGLTTSSGTAITTATSTTAVSATFSTESSNHGSLFLTSTDLTVDSTKYYYIVVWINETGSAQNSTDYGSFTGTIYIEDAKGQGLTSTFTVSS